MGRSLAETAKFVLDSIKKLGFEIQPECRLWQMYQVLFDENENSRSILEDDPQFGVAKEALRDFQILGFAFDYLEEANDTNYLNILRQLMAKNDSVLSQYDLYGNSPSRDYQAELFVAAICSKARMIPIMYEEPDICCSLNGNEYGIAVKRVKSERQFVRRIREAAEQIEQARKPGVIVIDITLATNPQNLDGNTRITEDTFETYYHKFKYVYCEQQHLDHNKPIPDNYLNEFYKLYLAYFYRQKEEQIQRGIENKGVIGIVLHGHFINKCDNNYELETATLGVPIENSVFEDFSKGYIKALPNLQVG